MTASVDLRKRLAPQFGLDVAFSAPPGVTIVFGASGSGKTTLLRCLAGLSRPDSGRIIVGDRILFDSTTRIDVPVQERQVGYVFQQLALFPHLTVEDNIGYGLHRLEAGERRQRVLAIADSFRIAALLGRRPAQISGGERQRTALARSLVTQPSLLLLDEPLSALDHAIQSLILDDLRKWNEARRIPVLYVTHSHREVYELGERVVVLEHGRVLATGSPHDVLDRPGHSTLASLAGFENVFDATILERRYGDGIMHCRLHQSGTELEVPVTAAAAGEAIRIGIRAGDILLATAEPRGLSARNVFRGRLATLGSEGPTMVATIEAGARFVVHLTPQGAGALGLRAGMEVWVVIKTYSCRVLRG